MREEVASLSSTYFFDKLKKRIRVAEIGILKF